jgi:hypothetical protein
VYYLPVITVEKPSLKPILADPRFWLLVVCNMFAVMTVMMTFVHTHSGSESKLEPAAAMTAGDMSCPGFSNRNAHMKLHFKSWGWFYPGPQCIL